MRLLCGGEREETEPTSHRAGDCPGSGSGVLPPELHTGGHHSDQIESHTTALIIDQLSSWLYWNGRRLLWRLISEERQYFPVKESRRKWRTEDRWLSLLTAASFLPGPARLTLNLATPGSLVWANKHLTRQGLRVTWHHLPKLETLMKQCFS